MNILKRGVIAMMLVAVTNSAILCPAVNKRHLLILCNVKCCPQWSNIRILPISRKYPVCIIKITNYIFSTKAGEM